MKGMVVSASQNEFYNEMSSTKGDWLSLTDTLEEKRNDIK